jgi:hypothetical protein
MPNARIFKDNNIWFVHWNRNSTGCMSTAFKYADGAFAFWLQIEKQFVREQKAWAKIYALNMRLLNMHDMTFIQKLLKNKCSNITKRQYGYLSGIYERQCQ